MHSVSSNAVAKCLAYSLIEQKTGETWVDGKPIYRLVVQGAIGTTGTWVEIGDMSTYNIIVTTKQKQNGEFCVACYDTEDEAKAALDEVWQNLNPPFAFSATIDAPDDVVRELKGETKTKKEAESATFDFPTAVKKLLEGKKVRVVSWDKSEYLYYDSDLKQVYDEVDYDYNCIWSWADDVWEEYKGGVV